MSNIKIVTDSTAYLTNEEIVDHQITVVSLSVNFENSNFKETEKSQSEFYEQFKVSKSFPTTSQPSAGDFMDAYQSLLQKQDTEIISIHISSLISGTCQSANTAKANLGTERIQVFDSHTTAAALRIMVLAAAKMAADGASKEAIVERLAYLKENNELLFIVNDLKYLQKGGRIGRAGSLLGTLLNIKPLLHIKGEVALYDKVRTKRKAIARLIKELGKKLEERGLENMVVTILHVHDRDGAEKLAEMLKEEWPELDFDISACGPVIGAHVGIGGLGIAFAG